MDKHDTKDGTYDIDNPVGREAQHRSSPCILMHKNTGQYKIESNGQRIDDHCLHIELQFFSCLSTYTRYANTYKLHKLTTDDAIE